MKASFAPVADERSRVLVLGSLPGEVSLRQARYYAHPRNAFWPLMAAVTGAELVGATYIERLTRLQSAGVALWDVVRSAERTGSLDSAIHDPVGNDLNALLAELPRLRAIAFNGLTASALGRKLLVPRDDLTLLTLPSSSPAYTMAFDRKLERWRTLQPYLEEGSAHA